MWASNGTKITCAFTKVNQQMARGGGRVLAYSYMDDESMQNRNNPGEGGMKVFCIPRFAFFCWYEQILWTKLSASLK